MPLDLIPITFQIFLRSFLFYVYHFNFLCRLFWFLVCLIADFFLDNIILWLLFSRCSFAISLFSNAVIVMMVIRLFIHSIIFFIDNSKLKWKINIIWKLKPKLSYLHIYLLIHMTYDSYRQLLLSLAILLFYVYTIYFHNNLYSNKIQFVALILIRDFIPIQYNHKIITIFSFALSYATGLVSFVLMIDTSSDWFSDIDIDRS